MRLSQGLYISSGLLAKRGDERSGCPLPFSIFLKRKGLKNPLLYFKGALYSNAQVQLIQLNPQ